MDTKMHYAQVVALAGVFLTVMAYAGGTKPINPFHPLIEPRRIRRLLTKGVDVFGIGTIQELLTAVCPLLVQLWRGLR